MFTQVTNNVNNANGGNSGNGGNNGCTYKGFMTCNPKEYDGKGGAIALTRWIKKIENLIDNSGCDETIQKFKFKQRGREDSNSYVHGMIFRHCVVRGSSILAMKWRKLESSFESKDGRANHACLYRSNASELTQPTTIQSAILRAGILTDEAVSCGTLTKGNDKRKIRGRAFNVNVNTMEAVQDPNVVTCTFSLNDHFVTLLFESGADFSFISTKFVPLLNVKPSIANPGYVIEVADGKKVKVDSIFRDCKLELGSSLMQEDIQCAGSDTRPPMLDRTDFESWQQRIRLYCLGKDNGENIMKSIKEGPFHMGTVSDA
ncbi:reverse transcriptase domain-containing protein [Tanacetum coccineum]